MVIEAWKYLEIEPDIYIKSVAAFMKIKENV